MMRTTFTFVTLTTLVMSASMLLPTSAFAQTSVNPLQQLEKAGQQIVTNAEKQAKGLLGKIHITSTSYVTQKQAISDLIAAFNEVPSWPGTVYNKKNSENLPFNQITLWPPKWPRYEPKQLTDWVGLTDVFPNQPSSKWPTLLNMTASGNPNIVTYATAGQVAQWVQIWAKKARNTYPGYEGMPTNAYQLMADFTLWHGTNVTSPSSRLTQADMNAIGQNLFAAAVGYRMLNHSTIEFVPVLGGTGFSSQTDAYESAFFKIFDKGITLIFRPNGTAIYHRPATNGFDVYISNGSPVNWQGNSFENGYNATNVTLGTQKGKPDPIFYGVINSVIHTGKQGTLPFEGAPIITPQSWQDPTDTSLGGESFAGVIHYNHGSITWVDSLGYQYSPYGYPGK